MEAECTVAFFRFSCCIEFTCLTSIDPSVNVCLEDITFETDHSILTLKVSKTDPFWQGVQLKKYATITNIDESPLDIISNSDKCINYANEKELSCQSKLEPEVSSRSRLTESTSGNVVLNKLLAQNQLLINKLCEISTQGYNPRQQEEETDSDNFEEEAVVIVFPVKSQETLDVLDSLLSAGGNQDNGTRIYLLR
ncbi:hypothetical protein KUTeg_006703 [Tegillarca granosa]|uniref:Uncharacterized protein n=1 Tax=Tegillarca granosa TaxID=220873 RepID=A0ABQ9FB29_TEGGR|nr:hypothetical protein KUTeg_006703 [Tegillarca granosa]